MEQLLLVVAIGLLALIAMGQSAHHHTFHRRVRVHKLSVRRPESAARDLPEQSAGGAPQSECAAERQKPLR